MLWDALDGLVRLGKGVFDWATGGRSRDENKDRDEAAHWREEEEKARLAGDHVHASFARDRLFKLQRKAQAKSGR